MNGMVSIRRAGTVASLPLLLLATTTSPVGAATPTPMVVVVADGLNNPRGLEASPDGRVYVAETGRGGDECETDPGGYRVCWGDTGRILEIQHRRVTERVTGLPSVAEEDGSFASGLHDVGFRGRSNFDATIGQGPPDDHRYSTLVKAYSPRASKVLADLGRFEQDHNPDGRDVVSNPYGLATVPHGTFVADAAANALLRVARDGSVATAAVFPGVKTTTPWGDPFLADPVPTGVAVGPDGALYVSELVGWPFPRDAGRVWRVEHGRKPTVYAKGFTAAVDLDFDDDGNLYVLELAARGLLVAGDTGDFRGALLRVNDDGSHTEIARGRLIAPGGLAIVGDRAFVTDHSVFAGSGRVLRIDLPQP